MFAGGRQLSKDRFEVMQGVKILFYDSGSKKREFQEFGLVEFSEINEPHNIMDKKPPVNYIIIKCKKEL